MDELLGLRVRDPNGRNGCISAAGQNELHIDWTDRGVLVPMTERVRVDGPQPRKLYVLTLTEGWKPMADVIAEAEEQPLTLLEDLENLIAEVDPLEEAKKGAGKKVSGKGLEKKARERRRSRSKGRKGGASHNPFKTKKKLGQGPRGGENRQTNNWKCSCPTPYRCMCRGKGGRKKTIKIKKPWKASYNHEYKAWRKKQKF